MNNTLKIARKEFAGFFSSPIAFIFGSSGITVGKNAWFMQPDSVWTARGCPPAIPGGESMWKTGGMFVPHIPPVSHTHPPPDHTPPGKRWWTRLALQQQDF